MTTPATSAGTTKSWMKTINRWEKLSRTFLWGTKALGKALLMGDHSLILSAGSIRYRIQGCSH